MLSKEELLEYPNYLSTKYQLEIYRLVSNYMTVNKLSKENMADKLGCGVRDLNVILEGDFNGNLFDLIRMMLAIGMVSDLKFVTKEEYLKTI